MKKAILLCVFLLACGKDSTGPQYSVSGVWNGYGTGPGSRDLYFTTWTLQQSGSQVTGNGVFSVGAFPSSDYQVTVGGTVDGQNVTLLATGAGRAWTVKGVFTAQGTIAGTLTGTNEGSLNLQKQ